MSNGKVAMEQMIEVSSSYNGARIVFVTDDCFNPVEHLIQGSEPVQMEGHNTFSGSKMMDGWETQRTETGHNFVIIQLPTECKIRFISIDTAYFTNNYPMYFSIQAAKIDKLPIKKNLRRKLGKSCTEEEIQEVKMQASLETWPYLIEKTRLEPGFAEICKKFFYITHEKSITHVLLNIFPDGGVARLRVYGQPLYSKIPRSVDYEHEMDLITRYSGGRCVSFSTCHRGHPSNLLKATKPENASDGWETKKNFLNRVACPTQYTKVDEKEIKEEWAIFELGQSGTVSHVVIDTSCFRGNAPRFVRVQGSLSKYTWHNMIPHTEVIQGSEQIILVKENVDKEVTFIKLVFKPNGGINRFKVIGKRK